MLNLSETHPDTPELQLKYCSWYSLSVLDIKIKTWYIPVVDLSFLRTPTFLRFLCHSDAEHCLPSMHFSRLSLASFAATQVAAVTLWASSYGGAGLGDGGVTTLKLDKADMGGYTLKKTSFLNGTTSCGAQSSWLTKDAWNNVIYCVDEAWGQANGSMTSFHTSPDGSLTLFDKQLTLGSPVSTVLYNGGAALAAAH
jgi:Lactonase, 7-bladed beta-propeller